MDWDKVRQDRRSELEQHPMWTSLGELTELLASQEDVPTDQVELRELALLRISALRNYLSGLDLGLVDVATAVRGHGNVDKTMNSASIHSFRSGCFSFRATTSALRSKAVADEDESIASL